MNSQLHSGVKMFSTGADQLIVKVKSASKEEINSGMHEY